MEWLPLIVAALIIGIAKTSFGGLGSVAVALMALVMPTKESTAAALLLLITGDIVAVLRYRSNADWACCAVCCRPCCPACCSARSSSVW